MIDAGRATDKVCRRNFVGVYIAVGREVSRSCVKLPLLNVISRQT